ncbi:MAG: type II secretion system F family protein [Candidatus Micrarchaeota archaeon]
MPQDKLKRLSETVRSDFKKDELDKIISKLSPKEEAVSEKPSLDFRRVELEEGGLFSLIGSFYSSLEGPVEGIAGFLSGFPAVRELNKNLRAAGLDFNAETYLVIASSVSLFLAFLSFIFLAGVSVSLNDQLTLLVSPAIALMVFLVSAILVLAFPVARANDRALQVDKALPFALRQLATQLKAGVSFYKSLSSITKAEYGLLSTEFEFVLRDLDSGLSNDEALKSLLMRNKSEGLRNAVLQIIRAMKTGGNLSEVISEIADDVSFETRQKIRDFTEKLNFINILYIMLGVVMPVAVAILSAILQIPLFAGSIPSWFVYAGFTLSIFFMLIILYVTKRIEPAAW